jgi:2-(1,2-epoxy-1,2-dihydrophenyl)acetyl-CoA isomerase
MAGADASAAAVVSERDGPVAILRLNEPETLNALSPAIKAGLKATVLAALDDPAVRVIVLTGEGRAFCAGGDIRAMDERRPVVVRARLQALHRWLAALLTTEKPVVTAVNGVAAGAGLSLALTGDIVCAAHTARFKAGFPGIGAVPDLAVAYTLPRAVGLKRAADILLTNRDVTAEEALAMGLVSRLFAAEELMAGVLEIAHQLARGPLSLGLTKRLLQGAFQQPLETFLEAEALAQATAFGSEDFAEGVAAFRGKRKPTFGGA